MSNACTAWICEGLRRFALAWAALTLASPAAATSYEACRAMVVQHYIARCTVGQGRCDVVGCDTQARCERGNRRCEHALSGDNYLTAKTGTRYCASVGGIHTGADPDEVAEKMCMPNADESERAQRLARYRSADQAQDANDLALAQGLLRIGEAFSKPDPRRRNPAPFVKPGRADHLITMCQGLAGIRLNRLDTELRARMARREPLTASELAELGSLKSARTHVCFCVGQSGEKQFSDEEIAETKSRTKLWGQLTQERLGEVFGPCGQKHGHSAESMAWLYTAPQR